MLASSTTTNACHDSHPCTGCHSLLSLSNKKTMASPVFARTTICSHMTLVVQWRGYRRSIFSHIRKQRWMISRNLFVSKDVASYTMWTIVYDAWASLHCTHVWDADVAFHLQCLNALVGHAVTESKPRLSIAIDLDKNEGNRNERLAQSMCPWSILTW